MNIQTVIELTVWAAVIVAVLVFVYLAGREVGWDEGWDEGWDVHCDLISRHRGRIINQDAERMIEFYRLRKAWSYETFGEPEDRGPVGPLRHLEKEAKEAREEAEKATALSPGWSIESLHEEIADCLFLVFDAADRAGMGWAGLTDACMAKLKKNKARKWSKPTGDDLPVEHDRSIDDIRV